MARKTKKLYYWAILAAVLLIAVYVLPRRAKRAVAPFQPAQQTEVIETKPGQTADQAKAPDSGELDNLKPGGENQPPAPGSSASPPVFSDGSEMEGYGPDILVAEIAYDGKAFSPQELVLKPGDIVFFKNSSENNFWPASDPHPEHSAYPEFDAKKAISRGGSFQFIFEKTGVWNFHDHLNPSAKGRVEVR